MICEICSQSVWLEQLYTWFEKTALCPVFHSHIWIAGGLEYPAGSSISAIQIRAVLERFCRSRRPGISGNRGKAGKSEKKGVGFFFCNQFCLSLSYLRTTFVRKQIEVLFECAYWDAASFQLKSSCLGKKLSWELKNFLEKLEPSCELLTL